MPLKNPSCFHKKKNSNTRSVWQKKIVSLPKSPSCTSTGQAWQMTHHIMVDLFKNVKMKFLSKSASFEIMHRERMLFLHIKLNEPLKFVHFNKTVARIMILSKLWYFQYKSKQKLPQFWKNRDSRNSLLKMNRH